ncbi:MAG: DUF3849 domain-containing protein [Clostridia bacterium]|nr:DUF3849 domain-containing protein [Clostridia bacterium]
MPEEKDYLPVYREPASCARENDELSPYRVSRRENIACKEAIEESIRKHFDGMHLDPAAVKEVLEAFGRSRTMFVLAVTVNEKDYDGRFSRSNKEWAKSFNIPQDRDSAFGDNRLPYVVNSHPAILDGFIDETRRELARKPSVLGKLAENAAAVKKTPPNHSAKSKQEVR